MKSVKNTNWKNQARGRDGRFTSGAGRSKKQGSGINPNGVGLTRDRIRNGPVKLTAAEGAAQRKQFLANAKRDRDAAKKQAGGSTSSNGVKRVQGTRNIGGEPFFQTNRGSGGKLTTDQKKMVGATKVQGVQMSEAAQAQYLRLTGGSSAGYGAQWMKIRAINQTNPKLTPAERRALGDNLPTSTMGKKLLAKNIVDTKRARQSAQYR